MNDLFLLGVLGTSWVACGSKPSELPVQPPPSPPATVTSAPAASVPGATSQAPTAPPPPTAVDGFDSADALVRAVFAEYNAKGVAAWGALLPSESLVAAVVTCQDPERGLAGDIAARRAKYAAAGANANDGETLELTSMEPPSVKARHEGDQRKGCVFAEPVDEIKIRVKFNTSKEGRIRDDSDTLHGLVIRGRYYFLRM